MLQCSKCGEYKSTDNFNPVKNRERGYHVWCKQCVKEYDHNRHAANKNKILKQKKERKQQLKEWFNELKSDLCCEKCGEDHIATLVFHHLDPKEKDRNVSDMVRRGFSLEKIKEEISKCMVLCANCHSILHWEERNGM